MSPGAAPQLFLIDPGGRRIQIPLEKTPFTIGRLNDNDLPVPDSRISRRHAVIEFDTGRYVIRDRQSRHGTFVNGERLETARPLRNNDRIEFGVPGSYALLFVSDAESLGRLLERVETPVASTPSGELRSLNLLLEVGRSLQAGLSLEDVLATVVDACLKVTGTERGFVFFRDEEGLLTLRVGRDREKNSLTAQDFQGSLSVVEDVLRGGRDVLVTNSLADEKLSQRASVVAQELRTIICLALRRLPTVGTLEGTMSGFLPEASGVIYLDSRVIGKSFSETDKQVLYSLATEAAGVIENARLFTAARDKERLDHELAIARDIQQALLPKQFRRADPFQVAGIYIPSQQVGGDYYDLIEIAGGRYAFVVTDVCGKGVSAALLTSTLQGALAAMIELGQPVDTVACHINRYICRHAGINKFATFFCGVLEPGGRFQYVNAGHVPPLLLPRQGDARVLLAGNIPLGIFERDDFQAEWLELAPGDTLVLYTDGFIEAADPEGELFGFERLEQVVASLRDSPVEELADGILGQVREFMQGTPPTDDMTLLVVRYEGNRQA